MQENQSQIPQTGSESARAAAFISLALIGAGTFLFTYEYLQQSGRGAQVAAAAEALPDPFAGVTIEAESAIIVDLTTGETLYEKNADAQLPLASLTKVATALAVSEVLDPAAVITIPYDTDYAGSPPTKMRRGEQWKVRDVLNFTLIASSNEGARILADAAETGLRAKYPAAPENDATLWRMNELAKELGLLHTYYLNVSGLDLSAAQAGAYGSARDMATLFSYAASTSPDLFAATTEGDIRLTSEDGQSTAAYNTDVAIGAIPTIVLGKTGYTDLAGGNLGVVFEVGLARPVVAIVLGSSEHGRFADMKVLVEAARRKMARTP